MGWGDKIGFGNGEVYISLRKEKTRSCHLRYSCIFSSFAHLELLLYKAIKKWLYTFRTQCFKQCQTSLQTPSSARKGPLWFSMYRLCTKSSARTKVLDDRFLNLPPPIKIEQTTFFFFWYIHNKTYRNLQYIQRKLWLHSFKRMINILKRCPACTKKVIDKIKNRWNWHTRSKMRCLSLSAMLVFCGTEGMCVCFVRTVPIIKIRVHMAHVQRCF